MSFSLYTVIAEHSKKTSSNPKAAAGQCILQCTGRPGARVALLQSPILPAALPILKTLTTETINN
jgi:hypothetical protein